MPRRADAATPRAWPRKCRGARRRCRRGFRWRRHAQRSRQRFAGSESALAPLPGGSTNVFARTLGLSDDRSRRRPRSLTRCCVARREGSASDRSTGATSSLIAASASMPPWSSRSTPIGSQALRRASVVHLRRDGDVDAALRPQEPPLPGAIRGRVGHRERLFRDLLQHRSLHLPGTDRSISRPT